MNGLAQESEDKIGVGVTISLYFELTQGFLFADWLTLKTY